MYLNNLYMIAMLFCVKMFYNITKCSNCLLMSWKRNIMKKLSFLVATILIMLTLSLSFVSAQEPSETDSDNINQLYEESYSESYAYSSVSTNPDNVYVVQSVDVVFEENYYFYYTNPYNLIYSMSSAFCGRGC